MRDISRASRGFYILLASAIWLFGASSTSAQTAEEVDVSAYLQDDGTNAVIDSGPNLRLYGFADFGLRYGTGQAAEIFGGRTPSFFVGNLNLYAAADLTERWKSLIEVRFLFLPDGVLDPSYKRTSTAVNDNSNLGATLRWGAINIERAWLEYSFHELLAIRGGAWLTPVGIWNVDHGSPAIIPALRPFAVNIALFPERQTGLEIYGSHLFGETTAGYHITISNGRGSLSSYADVDQNKAIGGRLFVSPPVAGSLTIGASGYLGRNTEAGYKISGTAIAEDITAQFDELSLAADLLWKWRGVHLQAEIFTQQAKYTSAGAVTPLLPGANGGVMPDFFRVSGYVLLAYGLPWFPLTPYLELAFVDFGGFELQQPGTPGTAYTYTAGLNYRPVPSVTLKLEYGHYVFEGGIQAANVFETIQAVAAWSF